MSPARQWIWFAIWQVLLAMLLALLLLTLGSPPAHAGSVTLAYSGSNVDDTVTTTGAYDITAWGVTGGSNGNANGERDGPITANSAASTSPITISTCTTDPDGASRTELMGFSIIVPDLRAFDMPLGFGANENQTAGEYSTASAALSTLWKTLGRWPISWTDTAAVPQQLSLVAAAIGAACSVAVGAVCGLAFGWAFRRSFMTWACDRTDGFGSSDADRAVDHTGPTRAA